jgi:hypothetical protein
MAFKLYIGERAIPLEKKFSGRSPAVSGRMCWLRDQINTDDDTLRVGVEFLEAMREVEYPTRMPPPPLALTGRPPEEIDGVMKAIAALEGEEETTQLGENQLDGSLCYMRHLNHRVLEQVQAQVSGMESRMVRKIQWMVQNASKLRQFFPWGQAVCSPVFAAAGVDKMQFAFYPSGYGNVTDGFCSLFLYAPAGCTLRCYLSIDKQVREIQHSWEEAGAFGRTNFCLFSDQIMDLVDDTILLSLEIEDAQMEVSSPWVHKEAATKVEGSHKSTGDREVTSITKLTKNPGKTPNGKPNGRDGKMDSAMHLASIWAAKAFVEGDSVKAAVPDGFHSFDEVVNRRPIPIRPSSRSPSPKGASNKRAAARGPARTESAPALTQTGRSAMQEDLSPPLPPVSAGSVVLGSASGGWNMQEPEPPGGASSYGKARKQAGRRQRPGSSAEQRPDPSGTASRFNATS